MWNEAGAGKPEMTKRTDAPRVVIFSCAGAPFSAEVLGYLGKHAPEALKHIVGVVLSRPRLGTPGYEALRDALSGRLSFGRIVNEARLIATYRTRKALAPLARSADRLIASMAPRNHLPWQRIEQFCESQGVPCHYTRSPESESTLGFLKALDPDLVAMITFNHILKPPILNIPRVGVFNIHPSYLPHFRGANPINEALKTNSRQTGVTIHWVDRGIDTGDIVAQQKVQIPQHCNEDQLRRLLAQSAAPLLGELMHSASLGNIPRHPQQHV